MVPVLVCTRTRLDTKSVFLQRGQVMRKEGEKRRKKTGPRFLLLNLFTQNKLTGFSPQHYFLCRTTTREATEEGPTQKSQESRRPAGTLGRYRALLCTRKPWQTDHWRETIGSYKKGKFKQPRYRGTETLCVQLRLALYVQYLLSFKRLSHVYWSLVNIYSYLSV